MRWIAMNGMKPQIALPTFFFVHKNENTAVNWIVVRFSKSYHLEGCDKADVLLFAYTRLITIINYSFIHSKIVQHNQN